MTRSRALVLIIVFGLALYLITRTSRRKNPSAGEPPPLPVPAGAEPFARPRSTLRPAPATVRASPSRIQTLTSPPVVASTPKSRRTSEPGPSSPPHQGALIPFVIEDGLAVVMGDIALGVPEEMHPGVTQMRRPERWSSPRLVYHIQPDLPAPERVLEAFRLFDGTPITFVPYVDQEDVLVFRTGTGACKSYLGRIGGKQPIWLSNSCGPVEIAHEILHAIGFIHEQNREDRDQYIRVLMENVEPGNDINFERLPASYMALTGLAPFDFTSIMLYPKTMFGVGGRETIESLRAGVDIEPTRGLSVSDRARLQRAFATPGP